MKNSPIWNPINRRNSREWTVQFLFFVDANPPENGIDAVLNDFWAQLIQNYDDAEADKRPIEDNLPPADVDETAEKQLCPQLDPKKLEIVAPKQYRLFAERLIHGVWANRDAIDASIQSYLQNWTLTRIGGVDRSVLRLAFYELFFSEETPPVVIINEAVDIAKFFSTRESGKFVNGILDNARKNVTRDSRAAQTQVHKKRAAKPHDTASDAATDALK